MELRLSVTIFLFALISGCCESAYNTYTLHNSRHSYLDPIIIRELDRVKRDVPLPQPTAVPVPTAAPVLDTNAPVNPVPPAAQANANSPTAVPVNASAAPTAKVDDSNRTVNVTTTGATEATTMTAVTKVPLLGQDGHGIYKGNLTDAPKVSEPLYPDENMTNVFKETPEILKAEQNITQLQYDNHSFYNSTFIGNLTYFNEHWANLSVKTPTVHEILSNSHRRATTITLSFPFPFYGHGLRNITVATGGFIYTGEHVHNWLAATQYIAPLMANFDTTLTNNSYIKMVDDGEKFTAFWENVTLQEDQTKTFTFAVTLYNTGDIIFAYKDIPIPVQTINDNDHPVKVGISDAYLTDRILFLVRRKTIYEYHRVSFKNYEIASGTLLKLTALPTCLQYDTCSSCVNHETGFDCMWCEAIHKCSSGTDRNKQDWMLRNCDKMPISNETSCPAPVGDVNATGDNTAYVTDEQTVYKHAEVNNINKPAPVSSDPVHAPVRDQMPTAAHSPIGGVVAAFLAITLVAGIVAWALYAFKNPHTRSGQLLIKYRPSQWSWRRGEARYTAATIHM